MASTTAIKQARTTIRAHANPAMGSTMTEADLVGVMKAAQGEKTLRDWADEIGVTASYISDIYHGRRSPGAKVLKYFGIGKTRRVSIEYRFL
jgi:transcriptional regulator with XRE-family HTH domain